MIGSFLDFGEDLVSFGELGFDGTLVLSFFSSFGLFVFGEGVLFFCSWEMIVRGIGFGLFGTRMRRVLGLGGSGDDAGEESPKRALIRDGF